MAKSTKRSSAHTSKTGKNATTTVSDDQMSDATKSKIAAAANMPVDKVENLFAGLDADTFENASDEDIAINDTIISQILGDINDTDAVDDIDDTDDTDSTDSTNTNDIDTDANLTALTTLSSNIHIMRNVTEMKAARQQNEIDKKRNKRKKQYEALLEDPAGAIPGRMDRAHENALNSGGILTQDIVRWCADINVSADALVERGLVSVHLRSARNKIREIMPANTWSKIEDSPATVQTIHDLTQTGLDLWHRALDETNDNPFLTTMSAERKLAHIINDILTQLTLA